MGWLWGYASDESTSTTSTSTRPSVRPSVALALALAQLRAVESSRQSWLAQASWVTVTDLRAFQFPHDSLGLIRVMYAKQAIHDPRSTIDARSVGRTDGRPPAWRKRFARKTEDRRQKTCGRCTWTIHGHQSNIHARPSIWSLLSSLLSCPVLSSLYAERCTL